VTHGARAAEHAGEAECGETRSGEEKTGFASCGSEMGYGQHLHVAAEGVNGGRRLECVGGAVGLRSDSDKRALARSLQSLARACER
jgi:hypothetical protein